VGSGTAIGGEILADVAVAVIGRIEGVVALFF